MKTMLVRHLPEETHRKLKATAAMNGKGLNAFIIELFDAATSGSVFVDGRKVVKKKAG